MNQQPQAATAAGSLTTLWTLGSSGELADSELLARYLSRRDDASEAAFRVIVERHGTMVVHVCRQLLGNAHDAQDAAQAVFLILSRRARSIRRLDSLAPWLHGVARRVAARARHRALNRQKTEARIVADVARRMDSALRSEPIADWEAVHAEVARLPEKYRAPIVLCYLEGLTYEAAARQIGSPVGTVRVRLSRARERLRKGLERRGFGPASFAQLLADRPVPPELDASWQPPSVRWIDATARSAIGFASGQSREVGRISAQALVLTSEVLKAMTFSKIKLAMLSLGVVGLVTVVGSVLVGQERPTEKVAPRGTPAAGASRGSREELAQRLLESAVTRLNAQRAFYEEGRISVDRYIEASRQVRDAELRVAHGKEQPVAAMRAHVVRLTNVLKRKTSELADGRGTIADATEVEQALDLAVLELYDASETAGADAARAMEPLLVIIKKLHEDAKRVISDRSVTAP